MNAQTDEHLMLAVGQGDLDAFEQIVLRHQAEAWRVAYRYAGDASEAEDLAQSAFLKLLDAAPRYKVSAENNPTICRRQSMIRVFVSSVQKELAEERRAVKAFILGDPLLRRFISDVFLFEDIPAGDRQPDNIYLTEVEQRDIYLGLFGNEYGWKNEDGKSPTELEFDHATKSGRERLVFVKGDDDKARDPDMAKLIRKAGTQLTRRRFSDTPALIREVYAALVDYLERRELLHALPFDDSPCSGATLNDIDSAAIEDFVETANSRMA